MPEPYTSEMKREFDRIVRAMFAGGYGLQEIKAAVEDVIAKVNEETAAEVYGGGA